MQKNEMRCSLLRLGLSSKAKRWNEMALEYSKIHLHHDVIDVSTSHVSRPQETIGVMPSFVPLSCVDDQKFKTQLYVTLQ